MRPLRPIPSDPAEAVIVAAHGCRRRPLANRLVESHVLRLRLLYGIREARAAYRQGDPTFSDVLEGITAGRVTVVPFFAAEGHFTQTVLPRELERSPRFAAVRVRRTAALGVQPEVRELAERRIRSTMRRQAMNAQSSVVVVVGHGTERHPNSGDSTRRLVDHLASRWVAREVHPAFLDQSPRIESVLEPLDGEDVVIFPFLMGGGMHELRDLPGRSRMGRGRRVIVRALGSDPGLTAIIARLVGKKKRTHRGGAEGIEVGIAEVQSLQHSFLASTPSASLW